MPEIADLSESAEIEGPSPIEGYRAISAWAMLALGLGLLSAVAILSPLLTIIPLAAMAIGGYALWHISANSERLSGRWMAMAPLILAPLFLGWGMSLEFSRRERLFSHAREFADGLLDLLNRKETYLAYQLKIPGNQRLDLHQNMEVAYHENETAMTELKMFLDNQPTKEILEAAPNARFQFEGFPRHLHTGFMDTITMQYVVETPALRETRFWITVQRSFSIYTNRSDWVVQEITTRKPRDL